MKDSHKPIAVFLYGAPGSGKGTQAELLNEKFGFFHFDSGDFLRKILWNPKNGKSKIIERERKRNQSGQLNTPSWFLGSVTQFIKKLIGRKENIVFSGSIRTLYEAFGDKKKQGLITVLERAYGKKKLFFIKIDLPETDSIKRNSKRLLCSSCNASLIPQYLNSGKKHCPLCAGKLFHRLDDDPGIIKKRLLVYKKQTAPIFKELKKRKYNFVHIDGRPWPYEIHDKIISHLGLES